MVRRTDADLQKTVVDQLPDGWRMENLGSCCSRCCLDSPEVVTPKEKADEKREKMRELRMQTAEITSLESPTTAAASPLVSDKCTRCKLDISEMQSWRPDPLATGFAKAHRVCLDAALSGRTL
jgi:hypothetical protein